MPMLRETWARTSDILTIVTPLLVLGSVVLAEELGKSTFGGFAITVLVHTDMASPHLVNAGSPEQIKAWLPRIVSGEAISAVAVTEPDAGSDVKSIRTTAKQDGGDAKLLAIADAEWRTIAGE